MQEGQELTLEYKRAGMKGYIEVVAIDAAEDMGMDDVPSVEYES
jgi:hypothetical protein